MNAYLNFHKRDCAPPLMRRKKPAWRLNAYLICAFLCIINGAEAQNSIIVQSTTSTANSGLMNHLLPLFYDDAGIKVKLIAVGTGQAIHNAKNGDGDVLLVHAKTAEDEFVAAGHGLARYDVMYNDFILVGPSGDPAGLLSARRAVDAMAMLAAGNTVFISRGDDSGTHKKELSLWEGAGISVIPADISSWYHSSGSGMGASLNMAVAMDGYCLTDRASWISFQNKADHQILFEGDPMLFNQYGVIAVNPKRHPHVNHQGAEILINWLLSDRGQRAINQFRVNGKQLFIANARKNRQF